MNNVPDFQNHYITSVNWQIYANPNHESMFVYGCGHTCRYEKKFLGLFH